MSDTTNQFKINFQKTIISLISTTPPPHAFYVEPDLINAIELLFYSSPQQNPGFASLNSIPLTPFTTIPTGTNCIFMVRASVAAISCISRFSGQNNKAKILFVPHVTEHVKTFLNDINELPIECLSFDWSYSFLDLDLFHFHLPRCLHDTLMDNNISSTPIIAQGLYDIFQKSSLPQRFVVKGDLSQVVFAQLLRLFAKPPQMSQSGSGSTSSDGQMLAPGAVPPEKKGLEFFPYTPPAIPFIISNAFIFDRTVDMITPFLTEHTYSGRMLELLENDSELFVRFTPKPSPSGPASLGSSSASSSSGSSKGDPMHLAVLSCKDSVWTITDGLFFDQALSKMESTYNNLMEAVQNKSSKGMDDLLQLVKTLPAMKAMQTSILDVHKNIVKELTPMTGSRPYTDRVKLELNVLDGTEKTESTSDCVAGLNPKTAVVFDQEKKKKSSSDVTSSVYMKKGFFSLMGNKGADRDVMSHTEDVKQYVEQSLFMMRQPTFAKHAALSKSSSASASQPSLLSSSLFASSSSSSSSFGDPSNPFGSQFVPSLASLLKLLVLHTSVTGGFKEEEFNKVRSLLLNYVGHGFLKVLLQLEQAGLFKASSYSHLPFSSSQALTAFTDSYLSSSQSSSSSSSSSALSSSLSSSPAPSAFGLSSSFSSSSSSSSSSDSSSYPHSIYNPNLSRFTGKFLKLAPQLQLMMREDDGSYAQNSPFPPIDRERDFSSLFVDYAPLLVRLVQFAFAPFGWNQMERILDESVAGKTSVWVRAEGARSSKRKEEEQFEQRDSSSGGSGSGSSSFSSDSDADVDPVEERFIFERVFNPQKHSIQEKAEEEDPAAKASENEGGIAIQHKLTDADVDRVKDEVGLFGEDAALATGGGASSGALGSGSAFSSQSAPSPWVTKKSKAAAQSTVSPLNAAIQAKQSRLARSPPAAEENRRFFTEVPLSSFPPIPVTPPSASYPSSPSSPPTVSLVVVIGGMTLSELSCFRLLSKYTGNKFIFATTSVVTGEMMIEHLIGWK
ncbi:Homotypic fusion and vacuole protein sorting (HOPS) complex component Vps33B [Monocercomonoides exilis]|uniref:Homotypic fusion and vacuole protein sorting (HOPS) complex component Vps33B n=1 Tax=Monocercomonoides exilis TaxID=2049356 RepID=UPI00355A4000|nr:Homotypic fusion and vacuole protein sorting (HOPS) complex component Vps33B [Monocercomonoides exilis]|eukprot:MONOS_5814.1-p1 / transcript=MONOS_5814.1 / gene=MONOS_5814 / organism=Monocercomonoides_exilis_PA203 / gene_product= Homotypic fusion and vacuole protein sorting (HOPS) complex component Vps33B / transcript_product= Homotypic fusion and vacuole protein sorting (HOPS) complex component Vps33B / location=Mono_scaffold00174:64618-68040(-) / protein_length=1011 / sequence_SO=supercontig / SO=protein_coding / is_pseudo=false